MPITKKGFDFHTLRPILANPGYRQKRGCLKTDALAKLLVRTLINCSGGCRASSNVSQLSTRAENVKQLW